MSQEKNWGQINFWKKPSLCFLSDLVWNVFGFLSKLSCWGYQSCLLRVHSNILEKKCLKFSDVGQKTIGILWQTLRQGWQNCFPGVHGNKLSRKTFRWKPYIFLFRHWAENFHFSPKVFWLGCQNCIPPGNRIILRRSILFEFSSIFFGDLAKILRDFVDCLSTGLSKLHSSCPTDSLSWICFAKVVVLFINFGLSDKKILLSGRKISPCLSKVHSNCPLGQLEGSFSLETFFGHF